MAGIRGGNLFISEDNIVIWGDRDIPGSGLYDNNLRSFVNDATVTFALKNSGGTTVTSATGTCTYVTGTQGCYEGVLEDVVSLTENSTYYLEVTATGSSDRIGFRRIPYVAQYHGSD
jgi:hypothetical protein